MLKQSSKFVKFFLLVVVLVAVSGTGYVYADAATDARIEKLEIALMQLQTELQELKADKKAVESVSKEQIETVVIKVLEDKGTVGTVPGWLNKIKFSGDFRYRYETIDNVQNGDWVKGQTRNRIRARLGLDVEINDELDVNFRFASGSMDPVSSNQTLTDSFSTKDFLLDRGYLDWHPASVEGLSVYAGKMKNPFYTPIKTELVWDSDLNPEGGAITFVKKIDDDTKVYLTGAGFWVDENSGGVDTSLWGAQAYIKKELEEKRYVLGGISYYDYGNIKNRGNLKSTWSSSPSFYGNTTVNRGGSDVFATDFNILELFGEYGFQACGMPMAIAGDWVKNFGADSGKDTGWLVGMTFNKAKVAGTWQARYDYRDTQADAVLGSFSDSDFANGVTNSKGSEFGFDYMLAKDVMGSLTYFLNERGDDDADVRKIQADIKVRF